MPQKLNSVIGLLMRYTHTERWQGKRLPAYRGSGKVGVQKWILSDKQLLTWFCGKLGM